MDKKFSVDIYREDSIVYKEIIIVVKGYFCIISLRQGLEMVRFLGTATLISRLSDADIKLRVWHVYHRWRRRLVPISL